jgi:hypothetical protein
MHSDLNSVNQLFVSVISKQLSSEGCKSRRSHLQTLSNITLRGTMQMGGLLTIRSSVLCKKLFVARLFKKFVSFYGAPPFICVFKRSDYKRLCPEPHRSNFQIACPPFSCCLGRTIESTQMVTRLFMPIHYKQIPTVDVCWGKNYRSITYSLYERLTFSQEM